MIRQQSNPVLVPDNKSGAYVVREKPNGLNYIDIDTVDGSEKIDFGNVTTNPEYNFLGSGVLTVNGGLTMAANSDIVLPATSELTLNGLSPNLPIFTDGSNNLVSNALTGSDKVVMSVSPTLEGVVKIAANPMQLLLEDTGGGVDDKVLRWQVNAGRMHLDTMTDAYAVANPNVLSVDIGTGHVSINQAATAYTLGVGGSLYAESLNIGGTQPVTGILDDDTMSANSASDVVTQQSIKAYVDNNALDDSDYILVDGTRSLTGNWGVGGFDLDNVGNITIAANKDLLGSTSSDINWGNTFTVSGTYGVTQTGDLTINNPINYPSLTLKFNGVEYAEMYVTGTEMRISSTLGDIAFYAVGEVKSWSNVSIKANADLLGSTSSDIIWGNIFTVSGTYGVTQTGDLTINNPINYPSLTLKFNGVEYAEMYVTGTEMRISSTLGDIAFYAVGEVKSWSNVSIKANADLLGSTSSDINFGSGNFTVSGNTGNTKTGNLLINSGTYITSFIDDDTMSANSSTSIVSQQSLVAYVGSEISSAVITDHGALSGKGDDDHTQYVLANGTRNITGPLIIDDILTLKHTDPIMYFRNDAATLLGSVGNLSSGSMRLKCDTSHISIEASTYVAIQDDLYVNGDLTMGTGRDIIGTSSGFLDWAGDATIGGDFKTGGEIGWQTSSEIECGAGYSSSSSANSNRYNLSGKSFVVTNPTASRWYGFSGMVEKTVYEVINESTGAEAAVILEPSGTTARFTVVSEGRVSFLYYAGKMWVL